MATESFVRKKYNNWDSRCKILEKCDAQPDLETDKDLIQFDETDSELIFDDVSSESRAEGDVLEQEKCGAISDFHPENVTGNNDSD